MGAIGFGSTYVDVPAGHDSFTTMATIPGNPDPVAITASLDRTTGVVTWHLESIDLTTGGLPADPYAGFLPVEDGTGRGDGFVTFTIMPTAGVASGTQITNTATITFDPTYGANKPITTNQTLNTIDVGAPTSQVLPLPATTTTTDFTVSWSGTDDAGGSGIATYDVFVSDNGGPFTPFQTGTAATSATFTGSSGHTYGFYSVATDNVGHRQATPSAAEATTTVLAQQMLPPQVQGVVINDGSAQRSMVTRLTVTFDRLVTLDPGAFEVSKHGGGSVGLKVASSEVNGKTVAVLTFAGSDVIGGSLADGLYTLTVHGDKIHDGLGQALDGDANGTAGGDYVDAAIERLFGDADGDGDVDNSDVFAFKAAYSKSSGQEGYQPFFDFNGDGTINTIDFAEVKQRYGKRI